MKHGKRSSPPNSFTARREPIPAPPTTALHAMTLYVVSVAGPEPAWIRFDQNTGLPCFTFNRPAGMELSEAEALKARAAICCGGDLSVVEADA